MKPTERQLHLMSYAGPEHSFWRVSKWPKPLGMSSSIIRAYVYQRNDRLPGERELQKMLDAGWIELRDDAKSNVTRSDTGEVIATGHRVWLTDAGKKLILENTK